MNNDLLTQLNDTCRMFAYFSVVLHDSIETSDTAQLLIFVRTVNDRFDVVIELLSVAAVKGTATDEDLYESLERCKLSWNK